MRQKGNKQNVFAYRPSPIVHRLSGFTFLETLIVVALFSIISVSLFQTFSMGLKVWKLASTPNFTDRKAILGMERLTQELLRIRSYSGINFSGESDAVHFAEVVNDRIFNVTYRFDPEGGCVWRRAVSLQDMSEEKESPERQVMTSVKEFLLTYYGFDAQEKNFSFFESWNESATHLPYAVNISVTLEEGRSLSRVVWLPISGGDD
jgi:prepilin-type N-terminal cleavage/methylation domain-containing protein